MSEETIEQTDQTTPLSSETSDDNEMLTSTDYEDDSEEKQNDLSEEEQLKLKQKYFEALQNKGLNPIFKQQQDIAQNLNELLKKSDNFDANTFKDDTENYVKSIGMKVIQDTNPKLADTIEKAKDFDENDDFDENLTKNIRDNLDGFIDAVKQIQYDMKNKRNMSGWNKKITNKHIQALQQLGYYNDDSIPFNIGSKENIEEIDVNELKKWLEQKLNKIETKQNLIKGYRTDLQNQMDEYKDNTSFTTNQKVAFDNSDEFYKIAKPTIDTYKELITNYSQYLTPDVLTELESKVEQLKKYISDARLKGVSAGQMAEYTRLVNQVRKNVRDNYQNILTKMQAYSNSVSAEDAILNEIKSLASYEQYSQLPPAIFEKLPDEIKNKVMRLMELKAKLQKQQGKTKTISNKYKINASNKPSGEDSKPKLFNPMLNKGYSIHNKIAQHNAYNAAFQ